VESETLASFQGPWGSLRIGVAGYQFPGIANDEWDSNWLIVTGDAVLDGRSWSFRDPCLTTFEMRRLAEWLDQVVAGRADQASCGFTEPNLDFEQVSREAIRIGFSLEALPPWVNHESDFGEIGFSIPIDSQLEAAANNLRTLLARFPVRAGNGS
jgi:hypothetical protein